MKRNYTENYLFLALILLNFSTIAYSKAIEDDRYVIQGKTLHFQSATYGADYSLSLRAYDTSIVAAGGNAPSKVIIPPAPGYPELRDTIYELYIYWRDSVSPTVIVNQAKLIFEDPILGDVTIRTDQCYNRPAYNCGIFIRLARFHAASQTFVQQSTLLQSGAGALSTRRGKYRVEYYDTQGLVAVIPFSF